MRVILERCPHKLNLTFEDEPAWRAKRRTESLSDLHNQCEVTVEGNLAIVHGSAWYKPKEQL